jgi:hypothetical protein
MWKMFASALAPDILLVIGVHYRLLPHGMQGLLRPVAGGAPPIEAGTEGSQHLNKKSRRAQ